MITMDLISHDISLYRYAVTDVIEIHLLEPGVVFHSIPSTPGRDGPLKRSHGRGNCNENKENSQWSFHPGQLPLTTLLPSRGHVKPQQANLLGGVGQRGK